jgi:excinuclease UvrABC helicase subunit UvrB
MFSFVAKYAPDDDTGWSVQMFRPYVLMMNTRAKANLALEKDDVAAAISLVEKGIVKIERFLKEYSRGDEDPGSETGSSEITSLREWLVELKKIKPLTPVEKLRNEMEKAVQDEKYERAAELRDAIRDLRRKA